MAPAARVTPELDDWLADPAIRVAHRRQSSASEDELWRAARELSLSDTAMLGRLLRWRIPGLAGDLKYSRMFREPPFVVLDEGEHLLVSGLVGRIWTVRRDYPSLRDANEFRHWSQAGTARVVYAHWTEVVGDGRAALASETRVKPIGTQGSVGVAAVRPIVATFQHLVGNEGIRAAVRRAEQAGSQPSGA